MHRYQTARLVFFSLLLAGSCYTCQYREAVRPGLEPSISPRPGLPGLPPISLPFTYQIPSAQSPWSGYNGTRLANREVGAVSSQESAVLQVEVRKEYGASIQIYDKVTKQSLINFLDLGRESGMGSYGGPRSFADDSPRWKGIGYNPLQAGDDGHNPSPILFHGFVDGWIYTKAQSLSWPHQDARKLPFFYEQWVRVDSNKVHVHVRLTHQRPDKTFYAAESQEWPMMMINGARKVHFYNGSAPYTGDAATLTDGIESIKSDGNYITHQGTPFGLTEPWMGVDISSTTTGAVTTGEPRLIGLYCPGFFKANYNVAAIIARENGEGSNTHTYIANQPMAHLDSDNTWYKSYTYVLGSEREIRNYVYAQERFTKPDFLFNTFNGRNGWIIHDGGFDQKEPFTTNNWRVTFTGKTENGQTNAREAKLISPYGSWPASGFKEIYIRMAYSGPPGTPAQMPLQLVWLLNSQSPDGTDDRYPNQNRTRFTRPTRVTAQQSIPLVVTNDGQMHTYKLSFANKPMWKDIIQQFEITHEYSTSVIPPGEVLDIAYFGTRNPGE
ncbi:hypothetical protein [Spirosoma utsteinense]|uniref:Uncharacterized protein n=1 Tax=Spirosoma utsteinense TaxID=2585773 RepID=A0ABR6W5Y7_9BACT|nr:hypothetical protein [Spirosoma utsteinense]MBC3785829.1 hypothetical protein [Spirosoma utsteinense]MBC3792001.1 hypothetical protein [Spirosoma utsteinense]